MLLVIAVLRRWTAGRVHLSIASVDLQSMTIFNGFALSLRDKKTRNRGVVGDQCSPHNFKFLPKTIGHVTIWSKNHCTTSTPTASMDF